MNFEQLESRYIIFDTVKFEQLESGYIPFDTVKFEKCNESLTSDNTLLLNVLKVNDLSEHFLKARNLFHWPL